jgi:hypothetical protein
MADSTQLEQQAVERLSEDESLRGRGELTDFGFEPLLNWGIAAVTAYAQQRATDEAQMDTYTNRVREVVRAAVAAAEAGKLDDPAALTDFEPGDKAALQAKLAALTLSDDPDANGEQIASVLQEALSKPPEEAVSRQLSAISPETAQTTRESEAAEPKTEETVSKEPETKPKIEPVAPEIKSEVGVPEKKSDAPLPENASLLLESKSDAHQTRSEPKVEGVATEPSDLERHLGLAGLGRNRSFHADLGGTETNFDNPPPKEAKNAPDADAEDNNATALGNAVAGQLNKAFAGIRSLFSSNNDRKDTGENQDEQEKAHHQPQPEK